MARARTAALVVATIGALYLVATAARDLQPYDSAEFALNAAQLGVGHPPGQPLYLLVSAALVRLLPICAPSFALVLLSIGALVVGLALATLAGLRVEGRASEPLGALLLATLAGVAPLALPGVW